MAWTAILRDTPVRESGRWKVIIQYTDGVKTLNENYVVDKLTQNKLEKIARERVAELDASDLETTTLTAGLILDLTPPAGLTPPTQAELDAAAAQKAWFKDWDKLKQLQSLAASGLTVPATRATQISDLQTSLNTLWLNTYRNDI